MRDENLKGGLWLWRKSQRRNGSGKSCLSRPVESLTFPPKPYNCPAFSSLRKRAASRCNGWNCGLPMKWLLNDGRLNPLRSAVGEGSEVQAQRRRNGAGTERRHRALTEADAAAFSTFRARDERAGNDGRRAGAILARLPCQFPPVGPGGFIPD